MSYSTGLAIIARVFYIVAHMSILYCNLPKLDKFKRLSNMPMLGLGTIWIGRRWPTDNPNYKKPSNTEINSYLNFAWNFGIRMFDTAAAYGLSEQLLGRYFAENPDFLKDAFIATKWGEDFNTDSEESTINHSVEQLSFSLERPLSHLPRIDLLYIHKADCKILEDKSVKEKMLLLKENKIITYTGASISDKVGLKEALNKDCMWIDFIQTSAVVARDEPEVLETIFNKGIAVVVNSPVRKLSGGVTPKDSYLELANNPYVSFILTGTRRHLTETMDYFVNP